MTPPRRRWFAFSLRTLFVGVTAIAIPASQWPPIRCGPLVGPPHQRFYEISDCRINWLFVGAVGLECLVLVAWLRWQAARGLGGTGDR